MPVGGSQHVHMDRVLHDKAHTGGLNAAENKTTVTDFYKSVHRDARLKWFSNQNVNECNTAYPHATLLYRSLLHCQ